MTYAPTPEMITRVDRLDSYGGIVRRKWQGRDGRDWADRLRGAGKKHGADCGEHPAFKAREGW